MLQVWRSGDAMVLQVWALAVQRSVNGKDGRVVKAASAVTVGLIIGVSDSGSWTGCLGQ